MALTVLSDVIMPNAVLRAGVRGKNLRNNTRAMTANGHEAINVNWTKTLRQYELGYVPMSLDQWQALEALHEVTDAGAYGFLMSDPKDATVTVASGRAALVTGTTYQLQKVITSAGSSRTNTRTITRPLAAGFALFTSGTPIVTFTLDPLTGKVTIPSAPAAGTLTWSGSFYVPVHFMDDSLDWEMLRSGPYDGRLIAGPSVMLMEVRE